MLSSKQSSSLSQSRNASPRAMLPQLDCIGAIRFMVSSQ
jgi:hypothetical protein